MPAALMYNLCDDKYNWYYHTEPQKYCDNRKMYWPRGRVWGGSSSLNAMVYIRGHPLGTCSVFRLEVYFFPSGLDFALLLTTVLGRFNKIKHFYEVLARSIQELVFKTFNF